MSLDQVHLLRKPASDLLNKSLQKVQRKTTKIFSVLNNIDQQVNLFAPEPPVRIHVLSNPHDVISLKGQGQLCLLTCAE